MPPEPVFDFRSIRSGKIDGRRVGQQSGNVSLGRFAGNEIEQYQNALRHRCSRGSEGQ